jgi:hypothetical protein
VLIPSWCEEELKKNSARMLKVHSVQHLTSVMGYGLRLWEKRIPFNIYYSLAKYKEGIPNQSFNFAERDNSEWNKEGNVLNMESYDFLIDIDAGSHEDVMMAHESTRLIIDFFNTKNIPFELRFSGKGFHIIIPYRYFNISEAKEFLCFNPEEKKNVYALYSAIAKALSKEFSEMIDIKIYDSRRICKIPFSLACYENDVFVCYPFVNYCQFEEFKLNDFKLENFNLLIRQENRKIFNEEGTIKFLLELI